MSDNERLEQQVATMAATIEALESQIDELKAGESAHRDDVQKLSNGLAAITESLDEFASAGTDGAATPSAPGAAEKKPTSIAWVDVAPEHAAEVIEGLAAWIVTVAPFQAHRLDLQPCWHQHPAVVQLLLDLRAIWYGLYRVERDRPGSGTWMLVDWHLKYWPELITPINKLLRDCMSNGRHEPPRRSDEISMKSMQAMRDEAVAWASSHTPTPGAL